MMKGRGVVNAWVSPDAMHAGAGSTWTQHAHAGVRVGGGETKSVGQDAENASDIATPSGAKKSRGKKSNGGSGNTDSDATGGSRSGFDYFRGSRKVYVDRGEGN